MVKRILSQGTDDNKSLVDLYIDTFQVPKKVRTHYDEPETSTVFIFNAPDCPCSGVTTYASIGVSDVPLFAYGREVDFHLEIMLAADSNYKLAANMLTTACFCIMKNEWECYPGAIFPDIFSMYDESLTLRHACFVDPFLWEPCPPTTQFNTKKVAFLQMIGITEAEYQHAESFGFESLSKLLIKDSADTLDFNRKSVA